MATAIDWHVQNMLGSKIVYGAKNESALSCPHHAHRYVVIILLCGSTSVPYTRAGIYIIVT